MGGCTLLKARSDSTSPRRREPAATATPPDTGQRGVELPSSHPDNPAMPVTLPQNSHNGRDGGSCSPR